jgi:hypothetical protein
MQFKGMKTTHSRAWLCALLVSLATPVTLTLPAHADSSTFPNPNAMAPGDTRGAPGNSTSRRPGNLPAYGARPHAYTGVTCKTTSP